MTVTTELGPLMKTAPFGIEAPVHSDHRCPCAEGMTDNRGKRPELSADFDEQLAVQQNVGPRPRRIAVSGGINRHGAETRLEERRNKRPPVRPAALPAVRQQNRRARSPRGCRQAASQLKCVASAKELFVPRGRHARPRGKKPVSRLAQSIAAQLLLRTSVNSLAPKSPMVERLLSFRVLDLHHLGEFLLAVGLHEKCEGSRSHRR